MLSWGVSNTMACSNNPLLSFSLLAAAALAVAGCLAPDAVPGPDGTGGGGAGSGGGGGGGSGGNGGGGAPSFQLAWARSYGIDAPYDQRARGLDATPAGGVLLSGEYRGSFTMAPLAPLPNTEGLDAFVAELAPSGEPAWILGFAGLGEQRVHGAVAAPDGGVLVAGSFTQTLTLAGMDQGNSPSGQDGFVASFDAEQDLRWLVRLPGPGAQAAEAIALSPEGDVFLAGTFEGALTLGDITVPGSAGDQDFFVARLSPDGEPLWAISLGGDPAPLPGQQRCHLAASPEGGVHIAGNFSGTVRLDENLGAVGPRDLFVARIDASGVPVWGRTLGVPGRRQRAASIAVDAQGRTLLAGDLEGEATFGGVALKGLGDAPDALLALFEPSGALQWARRYGSVAEDHADAAAFDADGNLLVAGRFRGAIAFGPEDPLLGSGAVSDDDDIFLAMLRPDGAPLFARAFGSGGDQTPTALAASPDGSLLLGGYFAGVVDFGDGERNALLGDDAFAVKLQR